jgi:hypothetical protein
MIYNSSRSLQLLRLGSGVSSASFREGQEEAIRHPQENRRSTRAETDGQ